MTWSLPDTYHLAGTGRGTATFKFYEGRDILQARLTAGPVESPVPGDGHAGFGERPGETGREQSRHRAPGLLSDEAGQALRPPKGRTWAPRGARPVVRVRGAGGGRVSIAGVACYPA